MGWFVVGTLMLCFLVTFITYIWDIYNKRK